MKKKNKKGQLVTFDFSTSMILFIMFGIIIVTVVVFSMTFDDSAQYEFEFEYIFDNLENNLAYGEQTQNFMSNYRINMDNLRRFVSAYGDIDDYTVGTIEHNGKKSHGIGLYAEAYDTCMYFTHNNDLIEVSGKKAFGKTKNGACEDFIPHSKNPCEGYEHITSFIKPVLLDKGRYDTNKIVQMNLVVCKI